MMKWILLIGMLSINAQAEVLDWRLAPGDLQISKPTKRAEGQFSSLVVENFELSRAVGEPELPIKSFLVVGNPQDVQVSVQIVDSFRKQNLKPMPVQEQLCRCATDQLRTFQYKEASYRTQPSAFKVEAMGMWRGQPVSRVDVPMARYEAQSNSVSFYSQVRVQTNASLFDFPRADYKDYLIVVPESLARGISDFVAWKESQGYRVIVKKLQSPQITLEGIGLLVSESYKNEGIDFVLMIGDETVLPMYEVSTSGGTTTSDLYYFTMDGSSDTIPDMFYGRIPATSAEEVHFNLEKSISFDQLGTKNAQGLQRLIGIASNEGNGPSDNEYIKSIEEKMQTTFGYQTTHFYQNDKKSNPTELNASIDGGTAWLFYLGHGSGFSWPSMNRSYSVNDISRLKNKDQIKPIIIDVACMNGRLLPGYLGTSFTDTTSADAHGAAAYYGGTVNISWHPPAVMARGIAFEHAAKNFKHLGEALWAGQIYLAANWNNKKDVVDNFEWYHLQGDPSMDIQQ